jgi:hypothetical protein
MYKEKSSASDIREYQRTSDCLGWKPMALETWRSAGKNLVGENNSFSDVECAAACWWVLMLCC